MSKNYFELDAAGKKALADRHERPEAFAKSVKEIKTTVETTTEALTVEEEAAEEYPLNED
jgi:hypothetical protein